MERELNSWWIDAADQCRQRIANRLTRAIDTRKLEDNHITAETGRIAGFDMVAVTNHLPSEANLSAVWSPMGLLFKEEKLLPVRDVISDRKIATDKAHIPKRRLALTGIKESSVRLPSIEPISMILPSLAGKDQDYWC